VSNRSSPLALEFRYTGSGKGNKSSSSSSDVSGVIKGDDSELEGGLPGVGSSASLSGIHVKSEQEQDEATEAWECLRHAMERLSKDSICSMIRILNERYKSNI
jgi:hypothetical protein